MKYLQKLGKSIMLPVACLPLCGILMGIGTLLCPAAMQGGEITGLVPAVGLFPVKPGGDSVQVVIGTKVQAVADALREKMKLS